MLSNETTKKEEGTHITFEFRSVFHSIILNRRSSYKYNVVIITRLHQMSVRRRRRSYGTRTRTRRSFTDEQRRFFFLISVRREWPVRLKRNPGRFHPLDNSLSNDRPCTRHTVAVCCARTAYVFSGKSRRTKTLRIIVCRRDDVVVTSY